MIKLDHAILFLIGIITLFVDHCSMPERVTGGNSSETVIGRISKIDGSPACSTVVTMYPENFNPMVDDDDFLAIADTTDDDGTYLLKVQDTLSGYSLMARSLSAGTRVLITGVRTIHDSAVVYNGVLRNTGTIILVIPEAEKGAYVYIPGTDLVTVIDSTTTKIQIDSVPAGIIPRIIYSSETTQEPFKTKYSVVVQPDDTTLVVLANEDWGHTRRLYLNTSSGGADVPNDVHHFPVCIRMTKDNFDFTQANADGTDIRFTKMDGSPLPFEIERWNATDGQAEVWVAVDTVFGNDSTHYIVMYWGNPAAENQSAGVAVFDTGAGFQGVWHLAENGHTVANDATGNRFDGTLYNMNDSSSVPGCVGKARHFDGKDDCIVAVGTADGELDFPANGSYSLSLWAYADKVDSLWHGIAGKGHRQFYLQYKCFLDTAASWEFVEYQGGWNYSEDRTADTPHDKEWVYLTGIRDGERQCLYVNGKLVRDTALLNADDVERNTDGDFTIGCHLRYELLPAIVAMDSTHFNGIIDEVRVMSTVPDSNWIKLCYMNQKTVDALVEFK